MAQRCQTCGKGTSVGHKISHSNIKTLRRFRPNLQYKMINDAITGMRIRVRFCTRCMRTMVKSAPVRKAKKLAAAAA